MRFPVVLGVMLGVMLGVLLGEVGVGVSSGACCVSGMQAIPLHKTTYPNVGQGSPSSRRTH